MFELLIKEHFNAAHSLRGYNGKCANIHGHTWEVEVAVTGDELDAIGMLIDFGELKKLVKNKIELFDHQYINEIEGFTANNGLNPTAENIAIFLFHLLKHELNTKYPDIAIKEVKVWESHKACAIYRED